ncbi:MAG: hypothetical protein AB7P20_12800, partial [Rhizobiaceae bacterium]
MFISSPRKKLLDPKVNLNIRSRPHESRSHKLDRVIQVEKDIEMPILKSRSSKVIAALVATSALGVAALYGPSLLASKAVLTEASNDKVMKMPASSEA